MRLGITISNKFDCSALGFRLWIRQAASRHKKVNKFISSALDLLSLDKIGCALAEQFQTSLIVLLSAFTIFAV